MADIFRTNEHKIHSSQFEGRWGRSYNESWRNWIHSIRFRLDRGMSVSIFGFRFPLSLLQKRWNKNGKWKKCAWRKASSLKLANESEFHLKIVRSGCIKRWPVNSNIKSDRICTVGMGMTKWNQCLLLSVYHNLLFDDKLNRREKAHLQNSTEGITLRGKYIADIIGSKYKFSIRLFRLYTK